MIRLALLRHGHTDWNRQGRIQGRTDIPLDDDARAQLADLSLPPPWDRADLVASPLSRAIETARLVGRRVTSVEPALIEMNWGDWEGQHREVLHKNEALDYRDIEDWGWHYRPPRGETPATLRDRLVPWANRLTQNTVAVCHIGVMRVLLAHATGWNFDEPAPFRIKRNRLYIIHIADRGWTYVPPPLPLLTVAL